jgi:hypothetical protein
LNEGEKKRTIGRVPSGAIKTSPTRVCLSNDTFQDKKKIEEE